MVRKVAHCDDAACSSATITLLESIGISDGTSIAIGADNLGVIAYGASGLRVAHCQDILCSSATFSALERQVVRQISISIGSDGQPIIAYEQSGLRIAHCADLSCTDIVESLVAEGLGGSEPSIVIGADGLAAISFWGPSRLAFAHCENLLCTDSIVRIVDNGPRNGEFGSIAIGIDGLPIISYYDSVRKDLKVAHCPDPVTCAKRLGGSGGQNCLGRSDYG